MGIIRVTVEHGVRIEAVSARVHARVSAQSAWGATAAAKKAEQVRALVAELAQLDITEDAVDVTGVEVATGQGKILTNQQVTIRLQIAASSEQLPRLLGALAARQGVSVDRLEWVYEEFEASIPVTAEAMRMARRKADAVAEAGGLRVTGVSSASDTWSMPTRSDMAELGAQPLMRARSAAPLDLGLDMSSTTELSVRLTVDFEVASAGDA